MFQKFTGKRIFSRCLNFKIIHTAVFPFFAGGVFPIDIFSSSAKAVPLNVAALNKTSLFHAGAGDGPPKFGAGAAGASKFGAGAAGACAPKFGAGAGAPKALLIEDNVPKPLCVACICGCCWFISGIPEYVCTPTACGRGFLQ